MLHSTVRGVLLSWGGTFVGRKRKKKAWRLAPLRMLWVIWRREIGERLRNGEIDYQFLNKTFFYLFWDWVRLYIGDGSFLLLDFVDWLLLLLVFKLLLSFGFFVCIVYTLLLHLVLLIKKKKKDDFFFQMPKLKVHW